MSENDLPPGWTSAPLGSFTDIIGGSTPPRAEPANFGGHIVWLTPTEIPKQTVSVISNSREKLTEKGLTSSSIRWIPESSVLMTSRASIGFVAIAGERLTTNQGFASFILRDGLEPKFLGWWLRSQKSHLEDEAGGTTFKEISKAKLRTIHAPIAPTNEQRRIVSAIEEQFARLDAGVAALERTRANLKRYRASVLKAAVEGRLTERWREENPDVENTTMLLQRILEERRAQWEKDQFARYAEKKQNPPKNWRSKYKEPIASGVANLPELPSRWTWSSLGECFEVRVGATPSRKRPDYWNGDIPWISSGEVQFCRINTTREYITQAGLAGSSTQINPSGSVLLGIIGEGKTRGSAALNRGQAARSASSSHFGFRPRHLGSSAGGTGKLNSSSILQR